LTFIQIKRISYTYNAAFLPPREAIERSPLRFTWEYKNPAYYENRNGPDKYAVVLISGETGSALPVHAGGMAAGFHPTRVFSISEGVFQHKTFVTVYQGGGNESIKNSNQLLNIFYLTLFALLY